MPTEEQKAQWKEKHGDYYRILVGDKEYFLRKPTRPEYKMFINTVSQDLYGASYTLVYTCLLEPSKEEFKKDVESTLDLHINLAGALQNQFGSGAVGAGSKNS